MKRSILLCSLALSILLTGCANRDYLVLKTPQNVVDPTLPRVSKLKALSEMRQIALEWAPVIRPDVDGYRIYRADRGAKPVLIKTIKDRYSSHYLDDGLEPNTPYVYHMTILVGKKESLPSEPIEVKTLPVPEPVPFVAAVENIPKRAKIIWRPHPFLRVNGYIIERSDIENGRWKQVAKLKGRLQAEYIDDRLKEGWEAYYYRVLATTWDGVLSEPSRVVKVSLKPLPKMVQGVVATRDLPKKIRVEWRPVSESALSHYNVYRSIYEGGPYLVIARTRQREYVDPINEDGVKRYYKVTAVDRYGLESPKQEAPVVGMTLPKPKPPIIVRKRFDGESVYIEWFSPDERAREYIVKKEFGDSQKIYRGIRSTYFTDKDLVPGVIYTYKVYAVDRHGLVSKPSEEFVVGR
jgi:fibronectin type 3 domain-containing protein